jgi:hypothetical protein
MSKCDTLKVENHEYDVVQGAHRKCSTLVNEWKIEFLCFLSGKKKGEKEEKDRRSREI